MGAGSSSARAPGTLDKSTTADDVLRRFGGAAVEGRIVLITGASAGLGAETARVLARAGATVVMGVRDLAKAEGVAARIRAGVPGARLEMLRLDLADLESVRAAAASYRASGRPLHYLVANAGVMAPPLLPTLQGYESQWGANHLGHFLLTQELLPVLRASAPSRVINLSSVGHYLFTPPGGIMFDTCGLDAGRSAALRSAYDPWMWYSQSKLANILHAKELQRRSVAGGWGITAVALHPGNITNTELMRHSSAKNMLQMMSYGRFWSFSFTGGIVSHAKTIPQGAATTVRCVLDPTVQGGAYYSDCQPQPRGAPYTDDIMNDAALAARLWELSERQVAPGARAAE